MEFHGIFHGIPWCHQMGATKLWCHQMKYHLVPWNSMEYSMEFHGTLVPPNEVSLSSMEFHGTLRLSFCDMLPWTSKGYSVEFNGTLELTNKISPSSMGFHGFRRAPFQMTQVFHGIFHGIPCNSGAAKWNIIYFHGIPWKFEIVILINTMLPLTCMEYSMEFHGTLESPNKNSSSSTGFRGIRRVPFQMTQVFRGISWNIPWNSMELWGRQM